MIYYDFLVKSPYQKLGLILRMALSREKSFALLVALSFVTYLTIQLTELPGNKKGSTRITRLTSGESNAIDLYGDDIETTFLELAARCWLLQGGRVLDSSGEYEIIYELAARLEKPEPCDVTILTHATRDHLEDLLDLVARWQGPISIAIFTEREETAEALWDIAKLLACSTLIKMHVSFNLVFPLLGKNSTLVSIAPILLEQQRCQRANVPGQNYAKGNYPINLMKNVARMNTTTDYIMTTDEDLLPSSNLRQDFTSFVRKKKEFDNSSEFDRKLFVLPVFEIKSGVSAPFDKDQLLSLLNSGVARPFYSHVCDECQNRTRYEEWLKENSSTQLTPLYEVTWELPYEPFYISHRNIPLFDERFRQFGHDRSSLACELHIAGYVFTVMSNAFLIHPGWKTDASFHADRDKELQLNRAHYENFTEDLKMKYPESSRTCGG